HAIIQAGDRIALDFDAQNLGAGDTGRAKFGYYLSSDETITTSDTLIKTSHMRLQGTVAEHKDVSFRLPDNLTAGVYYIGVIADMDNHIAETSTNNNTASAAFRVVDTAQAGTADITLGNLTIIPSSASPGDAVRITYGIANAGTASASVNTQTGFYLSSDQTITTSDTFLGRESTKLGGGGRAQESDIVRLPSNLAQGTYYIGVIGDYNNRIAESDETNNIVSQAITITASATRDITISDLALSTTTAHAGAIIDASFTASTRGGAIAKTVKHGYYLSSDSIITTSDTLLATDRSDFSRATAENETASLILPTNLAAGTHYIGVIGDRRNRVTEQD
ncbi:MAG: CARDB domain-containing protein, partial [Pseudomonadota bacterium]